MGQHRFFLIVSILMAAVLPGLAFGQLTSVKVGHSAFADESVLYLARDIGIFKKYGIHLELIYIPGGSVAMQALLGKSLDFSLAGGTQLVYAQLKGADLRMIGGLNNRLPYVLMAREGITSAEQLKGKRVGISRFGSNTDFVVKLAATQLGLNPKRDIQVIQVGGQDTRMIAMKTGSIDATVLVPELVLVGRKFGFNPLLDFVAKGIEYQHIGVAARTDYLKSQSDTVKRFMRAYVESIHYYLTHRDEAIKKAMQLLKVNDPQIGELGFDVRLKSLPPDGKPTLKGIQLCLDDAAEDDPKAKLIGAQSLIDLSFLP
ncbi:MAG TPA: ABC transporter substrate-binding protein [Candidatus Binatia bacterium]